LYFKLLYEKQQLSPMAGLLFVQARDLKEGVKKTGNYAEIKGN